MKKKSAGNTDVAAMMDQIQEQLAVMNEKLDSFMTKSLTELAQALANSKPVPRPVQQLPLRPEMDYPPRRQMYAVVCFECGKDAELPFKPSGSRPVYCPECFAKRKGRPAPTTNQAPAASAPPTMGRGGQPSRTEPSASPSEKPKAKAAKPAKAPKKAAKKAVAKKKKR